jgi:hypothetical protein
MTNTTDSRTTELLRKLLDDRGVKHEDSELTDFHDGIKTYYTEWGGNDDGDGANVYVEYVDGTVLRMFDATPEQAIAATLGNGTCEIVLGEDDYGCDAMVCSKCFKKIDDACSPNYCPSCGRRVVMA